MLNGKMHISIYMKLMDNISRHMHEINSKFYLKFFRRYNVIVIITVKYYFHDFSVCRYYDKKYRVFLEMYRDQQKYATIMK